MIWNLLSWIVFGALAGWIASIIMKTNASQGFVMDVIVGIVGALIGGFLARTLLDFDPTNWSLSGLLIAVVGAVILLGVMKAVRSRT